VRPPDRGSGAILTVSARPNGGTMGADDSQASKERGMGKFITGLLVGLLTGLIFADMVFPDGFTHAVEQWSVRVQNRIPGR